MFTPNNQTKRTSLLDPRSAATLSKILRWTAAALAFTFILWALVAIVFCDFRNVAIALDAMAIANSGQGMNTPMFGWGPFQISTGYLISGLLTGLCFGVLEFWHSGKLDHWSGKKAISGVLATVFFFNFTLNMYFWEMHFGGSRPVYGFSERLGLFMHLLCLLLALICSLSLPILKLIRVSLETPDDLESPQGQIPNPSMPNIPFNIPNQSDQRDDMGW